jgi:hypothetical protein
MENIFKPKINKNYVFTRNTDGNVETAIFVRYYDGSADVDFDFGEFESRGYDNSLDAWKSALVELEERGFKLSKSLEL